MSAESAINSMSRSGRNVFTSSATISWNQNQTRKHPVEPPEEIAKADAEFEMTRVFDAAPQAVYDAWTRPEHLRQWWGRSDFTVTTCDADPRVGGEFRITMRALNGREYRVRGVYENLVEAVRLAFVYGLENEDRSHESRAIVTLAPDENRTRLTMKQTLLDRRQGRKGAAQGWVEGFDRLEIYLSGINLA